MPDDTSKMRQTDNDNRLLAVARLFLKLGAISFGGPAAHIALMEQEVVRKRAWLDREHFLDLLAATNLVPGPNATEMAIHIRSVRAGIDGCCFLAFVCHRSLDEPGDPALAAVADRTGFLEGFMLQWLP